jgi:hypothetical protein
VTTDSTTLPRCGSEWHRWDPHLHAPGTLLSDQFGDDWTGYLDAIENAQPRVRALGVTDYFCIRSYQRVRQYRREGRLSNVDLLFPNVEMRLNIETERRKGINIHLLFSPDEEDHEAQIERILGLLTFEFRKSNYACRLDEFERLGRTADPEQKDQEAARRTGANQFKVHLQQLKDLFRGEAWLARNCLVAVAAAEGDGTSGLQADASFHALREEIEAFADIIFSSKLTDRDYWLGKKAGFDVDVIEKKYGRLKPCMHGSDAHRTSRVLAPDHERACWIKAELTFEGLRQAVVEPEERVAIGKEAPIVARAFERIASVAVADAPWFSNPRIDLNPGLVAIIGARGSGKTALADIIACATGAVSKEAGDASFLRRASQPADLLGAARADIAWADGQHVAHDLATDPDSLFDDDRVPGVRYLSQQFVERLCSAEGLAGDLVAEIEAVVFEAIDKTERLGASDFAALRRVSVGPLVRTQDAHRLDIERLSREIATEDDAHEKVTALREKKKTLSTRLEAAKKELETLVAKGKDERVLRLTKLQTACTTAETDVQRLKLARQRADELRAEVRRDREDVFPTRLDVLRQRYAALGLEETDWPKFGLQFIGDVDAVLDARALSLDAEILVRLTGDPKRPHDATSEPAASWPLEVLRQQREGLKKEIGVDAAKAKRFAELTKEIAQQEVEGKKLDEQVAHDSGYAERRKALVQQRRDAYGKIFDGLRQEQVVLEKLYAPLRLHLDQNGGAPAKLEFVVRRRVDVDAWVKGGEQLLDLRSAGALRGRGSLKEAVAAALLPAWMTGGADEVATALQSFLEKYWADIRLGKPGVMDAAQTSSWLENVGRWLFSTSHIRLEYSLLHDGIEIERLSPGTRGIVLLTLYLAVDEWDNRPLLIDQPEENLDPKSVFDELVVYFRAARRRRQVILVTHNANLVVNTDADQVIVAEATRTSPSGLPVLSYRTGGLEDPAIRGDVCALLEGGEKAFLERERRYRFQSNPRT